MVNNPEVAESKKDKKKKKKKNKNKFNNSNTTSGATQWYVHLFIYVIFNMY